MSIMNNKTDTNIKANILSVQLVLSLIFPEYDLTLMPTVLMLNKETKEGKEQVLITNQNFE